MNFKCLPKVGFTYYAWSMTILYILTKNKTIGNIAFNYSNSAFIGYEGSYYVCSEPYNKLKTYFKNKHNISDSTFEKLNFIVHYLPSIYLFYHRNQWKFIKNPYIFGFKTFLTQLIWAFLTCNGLDVSDVYLPESETFKTVTKKHRYCIWLLTLNGHLTNAYISSLENYKYLIINNKINKIYNIILYKYILSKVQRKLISY